MTRGRITKETIVFARKPYLAKYCLNESLNISHMSKQGNLQSTSTDRADRMSAKNM
jgi:hypothetical protein